MGVPEPLPQRPCRLEDATHGVAYDQDAATAVELLFKPVREEIQVVIDTLQLDVHPTPRGRGPLQDRLTAGRDSRQERILLGLGDSAEVAGITFPPAGVRLDQFAAPGRREGCGEDHHRDAVGTQPREHPVEVGAHVRVVGVRLVDDDDLAGDREVAESEMTALQPGEQQLVDCACDERRQHGFLPAAQPCVRHQLRRG
ncbi:hypothetical protein ABZ802_31045 [Streptomyces sp. NPDC047737]|uniref:hypothetical protein n=1 Tax=Streptomyces sp. NPDC047737 TaxID=3155740 RepID=UPI0033D17D51